MEEEESLSFPCLLCSSPGAPLSGEPLPLLLAGGGGGSKEGGENNYCSRLLNSHLWSVFVLRNLLNYPKGQVEQLLRRLGGVSPGDWYYLCGPCSFLAKQTMELYHQIFELQEKIRGQRNDAYEKLRQSITTEADSLFPSKEEVSGVPEVIICARDEVREYFRGRLLPPKQEVVASDIEEEDPLHSEHEPELDDDEIEVPSNYNIQTEEVDSDWDPFEDESVPHEDPRSEKKLVKHDEVISTGTVSRVRNQRRNTSKKPLGFSEVLGRARACTAPARRKHRATLKKESAKLSRVGGVVKPIFETVTKSAVKSYKEKQKESKAAISKKKENSNSIRNKSDLKVDDIPSSAVVQVPKPKKSHKRKTPWRPKKKLATPETGGIKCEPCGKWYTPEHYPKHVKQTHDKSLNCQVCGYMATAEEYLERHLKRHEEDPTFHHFKCDRCDFSCSYTRHGARWIHLQMHKLEDNTVRREDGKLGCKCCSSAVVFENKSLLHIHIRECHGDAIGVRSYKCSTCDQGFNSSTQLKFHTRSKHSTTDELNKYPCDHCGAKFTYYPSLKTHIEVFHLEGERRDPPVVCDKCGKEYPNRRALQSHKRTIHGKTLEERRAAQAKGCKCPHCGLQSPHSTAYKKHLKSQHPDLFIFHCSKCLRKFILLKHLLIHEKTAHPPQQQST